MSGAYIYTAHWGKDRRSSRALYMRMRSVLFCSVLSALAAIIYKLSIRSGKWFLSSFSALDISEMRDNLSFFIKQSNI